MEALLGQKTVKASERKSKSKIHFSDNEFWKTGSDLSIFVSKVYSNRFVVKEGETAKLDTKRAKAGVGGLE